MLEVDVVIERVDGTRQSEKADVATQTKYSVRVSLSEKDWKTDSLALAYSLELASQPATAKILVTGTAVLRGAKSEIQALLASQKEKAPPPILAIIYERIYGLIYLLASSLRVPYPLPNLLEKGE